jgi:hypothetical protein
MKIEDAITKSLTEMNMLWVAMFALNIYLDEKNKLKKFAYLTTAYVTGLTLINYNKQDEHKKTSVDMYDHNYN